MAVKAISQPPRKLSVRSLVGYCAELPSLRLGKEHKCPRRGQVESRPWMESFGVLPPSTAAAASCPAVTADSRLHAVTLRDSRNDFRVPVQALKIQIPCPLVISNKSSSLRTQHSPTHRISFSLCLTEAHFPNDNGDRAELAVWARK